MQKNFKAPLVLDETLKGKIGTLGYDFYMFVQLLLFYFASLTIGGLCFLLDKLLRTDQFLDGFIWVVSKIGGATQKQ